LYVAENLRGRFNTPKGKTASGKEPKFNEEDMRNMSLFFQVFNVNISCSDYKDIKYVGNDLFVYFDPPYPRIKKTSFTSYNREGFDDDEFYLFLKKLNVTFFCSYSFTEELEKNVSKDFIHHKVIEARRSINSNSNDRKTKEMFFTNYIKIK
jgi:DNA adenine methylase